MKIALRNTSPEGYHGACVRKEEDDGHAPYFCKEGLKAVLGVKYFSKIEISRRQFKGSIKIKIKDRIFSSEKGEYEGCSDHPGVIADFLNKEKSPEFSFWAKIV